jgi:hypothetical protein
MITDIDNLYDFVLSSDLKTLKRAIKSGTVFDLGLLDEEFFTMCIEDEEKWFIAHQDIFLLLVREGLDRCLNEELTYTELLYSVVISASQHAGFEPTIKTLLDESGLKLGVEVLERIADHYVYQDNNVDISFFIPYAEDEETVAMINESIAEKKEMETN